MIRKCGSGTKGCLGASLAHFWSHFERILGQSSGMDIQNCTSYQHKTYDFAFSRKSHPLVPGCFILPPRGLQKGPRRPRERTLTASGRRQEAPRGGKEDLKSVQEASKRRQRASQDAPWGTPLPDENPFKASKFHMLRKARIWGQRLSGSDVGPFLGSF